MLELLVVVSIIVVLISLLMAGISIARRQRMRVLATTHVKEIHAAAEQYFAELRAYPPDTGTFEADETAAEACTIHRYLGMPVVDERGEKHGPFLTIKPEFLKGTPKTIAGVAGVQLFCDPWGNPYQLDALHVSVNATTGAVVRIGEPYPQGTPDTQKTSDMKVWSYGPDGKSNLGSLAPPGARTGVDADNITSWDN